MHHQRHILFFLTVFLTGICNSNATAQDKKGSSPGKHISSEEPIVSVYTSSRDGDRLTVKPNAKFSVKTELSPLAITINDKTVYQKIEGFGATFNEAGMICLHSIPITERNQVVKSLFDPVQGAGFTVMKSPIAACDFASGGPWYSYNETGDDTLMKNFSIKRDLGPNGLISYIKKAREFGNFEIESPMDFAPDWMYYSLDSNKRHIKPQYYMALARYYAKYLQAYAANGVNIGYLNLFNEANNTWYSNVTYSEIGELIKNYIGPGLKTNGIKTKIQFGETSSRPEAMEKFPPGLDQAGVMKWVHSLTVHGYDWDKFSSLDTLHKKYPTLPIWQTEVCYAMDDLKPPGGPAKLPCYDFEDGEFWGNMIANDMKHWVSAWIYWNMILDQDGGPWLISLEHGDPDNNYQQPVVIIDRKTKKVAYTGLYYYLAHFSRFVRPGAYRVNCTGGNNNLNYVGFKNKDGTIILNIINNSTAGDCSIVWNNKVIKQNLPAHSITTFKWKAG